MPRIIPWDRPRGSVHNVARALSLVDDGSCNVLLVSDATLYVLQNYMALDVEFKSRWVDQVFDNGYYPIEESSANYSAWVDLINLIQSEVTDVTCDLEPYLSRIAAALEAMQPAQTTWDDLFADWLAPLAEIATSADIAALSANLRQFDPCCGPVAELPYYPSPALPDENPGGSAMCDRSWSFARDWSDAATEIMDKWSTAQFLTMGILALITAALSIPVAIILGILAAIGTSIIEVNRDSLLAFPASLIADIACAVYNATNAESAKADIDSIITDADKPDLWPGAATIVLKLLVGIDALNQVFLESYPVRDDSVDSDCEECSEANPLALLETNYQYPYNALLTGYQAYPDGGQISSEAQGYRSYNEGGAAAWHFEFYAPNPAPTKTRFSFELHDGSGGDPINITIQYLRVGAEYLVNGTGPADCCGPELIDLGLIEVALVADNLYRVNLGTPDVGRTWWIRHVLVTDASDE